MTDHHLADFSHQVFLIPFLLCILTITQPIENTDHKC